MIEVGKYIRTKEGQIYKADEIFLKHANVDIKSHSKNIIDLIEVGDIVNQSERILDITGDYILTTERNCCKSRFEKTIKTILTHEIYEQNCYKLKE